MSQSPHLELGRQWLERGRADRAEEELRKALAEAPEDAECLALLAAVLLDQDRDREALEVARDAVGRAPDWSFAHVVLSRALGVNRRSKDAEVSAREALALDPEAPSAHAALAAALAGLKRWREALEAAEAGLELDPEDETCANIRAFALVQVGEGEAADFALEASLRRDPENPATHANLGWAALHAGDADVAVRHYREALRLDPTSDAARAGLVEALNARSPIYRLFLRWFLLLTRIPPRTVLLVMVGTIFARGALRRLAEGQPALAPVVTPLYWGLVAFILVSWIAQPLFNLLLRLDRDGRHALSERQVFQANWLLGWLFLTAALAALWGTGVPGMGLAAGLAGALTIPVVTTAQSSGRARRMLLGSTVALAVVGVLAVSHALDFERWKDENGRIYEQLAAASDEHRAFHELRVVTAERRVRKPMDDHVGIFALGFVAFTWLGGGFLSRR